LEMKRHIAGLSVDTNIALQRCSVEISTNRMAQKGMRSTVP